MAKNRRPKKDPAPGPLRLEYRKPSELAANPTIMRVGRSVVALPPTLNTTTLLEAVMSVGNSTESWRDVVGYEGYYQISDFGNVRSLGRRVRNGSGTRRVRARVVRQGKHKQGYRVVALQRGNRSRSFLVHRLVAAAFLPSIPTGSEINHKDGDKCNNTLSNLEIATRQENIDHAVRTGLIDNKGEKNARAKITAERVQEIRTLHAAGGVGYKAISKRFGLPWGTIRNVVKRRTWAHLAP